MTVPADKQIGQLNEGDVLLQVWENGVLSPVVMGPLSGTVLGIKAGGELKENISKGRGTRGKVVDSVSEAKPTEFSLGFNRATSKLLAIAFMGTSAGNTEASGTITAEPITLPHDTWIKTSQRNLSAVVITGKVIDADFEVDARNGMIRSLSTGSITDGEVTAFSATHAAVDSLRIKGGTKSKIEVQVIMDGINAVSGDDFYIRVPKVPLVPDADLDFLGDDYLELKFSGNMIKLPAEEAEFYYDGDVVLN